MITIQNADSALKDYYLDAISAQLNESISPFFTAIEKNTNNVYGKDVKIAVIKGGNGSVCAGAEDGNLPDPYKNRYVNITMPLKNIYGTIEITDKALRASRDSSGAFVNLLNAEAEGLVACARENFRRMLFGDGTGKLCKIVAKDSNKVLTVDNARQCFSGMRIDVTNLAGTVTASSEGLFIESVDTGSNKLYLSKEVTETVSSGSVLLHGVTDGQEITGLKAVFDSASLYGYNKSDDKYFAPYKKDCGGTLTEALLSDMLDYLEENYNSKVNIILCSFKTRKKIASLIDANRRVVNTIDARTGYGAVTVNDVPVYADKYCPDDRILFLNTADFSLNQLCDWEWLEDEDGKILKQIPGKAAYSATIVKYAELICSKPCGQGMLYNFVKTD